MNNALERVWISRTELSNDRIFCYIRHSMNFFISNLLYYLQVDVIDSEFTVLMKDVNAAKDFQTVLKANRNFLVSVVNLSMVENTAIQEAIERILQVCLRFVSVCKLLLSKNPGGDIGVSHLIVPPEEMEAIQKDFYTHTLYFFQMMQKVENRGFMFRLDFNGYLSQMAVSISGSVSATS